MSRLRFWLTDEPWRFDTADDGWYEDNTTPPGPPFEPPRDPPDPDASFALVMGCCFAIACVVFGVMLWSGWAR